MSTPSYRVGDRTIGDQQGVLENRRRRTSHGVGIPPPELPSIVELYLRRGRRYGDSNTTSQQCTMTFVRQLGSLVEFLDGNAEGPSLLIVPFSLPGQCQFFAGSCPLTAYVLVYVRRTAITSWNGA
jgi:hypothetical protein